MPEANSTKWDWIHQDPLQRHDCHCNCQLWDLYYAKQGLFQKTHRLLLALYSIQQRQSFWRDYLSFGKHLWANYNLIHLQWNNQHFVTHGLNILWFPHLHIRQMNNTKSLFNNGQIKAQRNCPLFPSPTTWLVTSFHPKPACFLGAKTGCAQNHTCLCSFHGVDVNQGVLRGVHRGVGGAIRCVDNLLWGTVLLIAVHDLRHCSPLRDKVHLQQTTDAVLKLE